MCTPDGSGCEGGGSLFDQIVATLIGIGKASTGTIAFLQGIFSGITVNHNETVLRSE